MDLVRGARKSEMEGFAERQVYTVVPRSTALQKGAKIIGVRWVDTWKMAMFEVGLSPKTSKRGRVSATKCSHRPPHFLPADGYAARWPRGTTGAQAVNA